MTGLLPPNDLEPDVDVSPTQTPSVLPGQTARDGSPARRPGDPDPAPAEDGAPLFSTDPLAGD